MGDGNFKQVHLAFAAKRSGAQEPVSEELKVDVEAELRQEEAQAAALPQPAGAHAAGGGGLRGGTDTTDEDRAMQEVGSVQISSRGMDMYLLIHVVCPRL